jgi:hypothetical protein
MISFHIPFLINYFTDLPRGLERSAGITMGYGLDGRGSIPGRGKRFSSNPQRPDQLWGPPNLLSNEYWGLYPRGLKRLGRETVCSLLSSSEVKSGGL